MEVVSVSRASTHKFAYNFGVEFEQFTPPFGLTLNVRQGSRPDCLLAPSPCAQLGHEGWYVVRMDPP